MNANTSKWLALIKVLSSDFSLIYYGENESAIFDDDRKALPSTLRKFKKHFDWILVQKLSSRLIIFLTYF